jgi:hypothetical protein
MEFLWFPWAGFFVYNGFIELGGSTIILNPIRSNKYNVEQTYLSNNPKGVPAIARSIAPGKSNDGSESAESAQALCCRAFSASQPN